MTTDPTKAAADVAEIRSWWCDKCATENYRGDDATKILSALDAQRREIERMEKALRKIDERRYHGRYTVTPDRAWEEFGKANAELCKIYDEAAAALTPSQEAEHG